MIPLAGAGESVALRFFDQGVAAARAGDDALAADNFRESASVRPAAGTLHNLGNAAWRAGARGPAILAWEQSLWLDPWSRETRTSLAHARHVGNLDSPELRWFEVCSTWLPQSWWPWLTMACFWGCMALLVLPTVCRWKGRDGSQALAAALAAATLLCLPALAGLQSRAGIGYVVVGQAPLRVTPTATAHVTGYLSSGTPVRWRRERGDYLLIQTRYSTGWVQRDEVGWIGGR